MSVQAIPVNTQGSSRPFDVGLFVVPRLKVSVPAFKQVRGVADYAAVKSIVGFTPPEAFAVPVGETGKDTAGQSRQPSIVLFGVVIAATNYRYDAGKPALDDITSLVGATRDALIGWTPVDSDGLQLQGGRPCTWVRGGVHSYDAGTLLWIEVFKTQHFIGRWQ